MAPNACLFSITHFHSSWQKIVTNKNIFSKQDIHVLFISFLSKIYNKKNIYSETIALTWSPLKIYRLLYFGQESIRTTYYYFINVIISVLHISSFIVVYIDIWHTVTVCYVLMHFSLPLKSNFWPLKMYLIPQFLT